MPPAATHGSNHRIENFAFVRDSPNELRDDVFDCDDPCRPSVLVDGECEVHTCRLHLRQQFDDSFCLGNDELPGGHGRHGSIRGVGDCRGEVSETYNTSDVVEITFINGEPAMSAVNRHVQRFGDVRIRADGDDLGPRCEDLTDRAISHLEGRAPSTHDRSLRSTLRRPHGKRVVATRPP